MSREGDEAVTLIRFQTRRMVVAGPRPNDECAGVILPCMVGLTTRPNEQIGNDLPDSLVQGPRPSQIGVQKPPTRLPHDQFLQLFILIISRVSVTHFFVTKSLTLP